MTTAGNASTIKRRPVCGLAEMDLTPDDISKQTIICVNVNGYRILDQHGTIWLRCIRLHPHPRLFGAKCKTGGEDGAGGSDCLCRRKRRLGTANESSSEPQF